MTPSSLCARMLLVAVPLLAVPLFGAARRISPSGGALAPTARTSKESGFALDIPAGALGTTRELSIDLANYTPATSTAPTAPLLHRGDALLPVSSYSALQLD
jgi:hypothetical protein